ncbi:hypothetical protein FLAG1_03650 [Fusarium langsethiae]|uniref:Ecp2 effector protein-like domain-containing protein n=1 Tax=Fusarium langsethiae TaxID=179993 RepID=A0A0M9F0M1_FUSLA|nr:hypothetical protein FLAG1_03650 [Fusarium langsethiae]GKU01666.1 unnamed protein product [Fusarium langsethiae]GKU18061.1 unnamed protein product [Fusarium langsethiae]
MHFINLITVFVGLAAAAPAPAVAPAATPTKDEMIAVTTSAPTASGDPFTYWSASCESVKVCDEDTYVGREAPRDTKRANYRDCAALLSSFGSRNGTFVVPRACEDDNEYAFGNGHVDVVKSGSCAFSVRADKGLMVGDEDIVWIMQKAVLDNSDGMEMAARGSVQCNAEDGKAMGGLYWEIHGVESTGY